MMTSIAVPWRTLFPKIDAKTSFARERLRRSQNREPNQANTIQIILLIKNIGISEKHRNKTTMASKSLLGDVLVLLLTVLTGRGFTSLFLC